MSFREYMEQFRRNIMRDWTACVETMLSETPGLSADTHTLVTVKTANGGMMAWVCPSDAVSHEPQVPRVVMEWSELTVKIRYVT